MTAMAVKPKTRGQSKVNFPSWTSTTASRCCRTGDQPTGFECPRQTRRRLRRRRLEAVSGLSNPLQLHGRDQRIARASAARRVFRENALSHKVPDVAQGRILRALGELRSFG